MKMEMEYVYRWTIQFFNLVCMLHAIFCLATYLMMDDSRRKLRKAAGLGEQQQPSCMVTLVTLFFLAMLCMIRYQYSFLYIGVCRAMFIANYSKDNSFKVAAAKYRYFILCLHG